MKVDPLVDPADFIGDGTQAYLATAARGLVPRAGAAATMRYFDARAGVAPALPSLDDTERAAKAAVATLLGAGVGANDIAFVGSTSDGINAIYSLVAWRGGDNIVLLTDELEFPSVVLPALRLESLGVTVRRVARPPGVSADEVLQTSLAEAVDDRTRLVFLSHVSYRTGHRIDLARLARAVRERGEPWFAVDASQSLGVVPVAAAMCDFVVSTAFKWLLGAHGAAILYWNRTRCPDVLPAAIGWHAVEDDLARPVALAPTAARFESGNGAYLAHYALEAGAKLLLDVGLEPVAAHSSTLATRLFDGLRERGLAVLTPEDPAQRAGIVCWADAACEATAAALRAREIIVSGSAGRVRAAMHLYNASEDVDRLLAALDGLAGSDVDA